MMNPGFPMGQFPFMAPKSGLAPALYVGDLDETIQEETLYDFFARFGQIHFVRIMRDNATGKSRGYAFVNFVNPRDAESAKQYGQYEKIGNKHIRIMFKRAINDIPEGANVYVKNIDPSTNVRDLHNHFNSAGNVLSAKIATDNSGNNLGYGYVQFEKPEEADNAVTNLNGQKLHERELVVEKFLKKTNRAHNEPKKNLYIKNLPSNTTDQKAIEELVKKLFSKFGNIESVGAVNRVNRWAAFVCFEKSDDAEKAIKYYAENRETLPGADEPVYVNVHQSKRERQILMSQNSLRAPNETNLFVKNLRLDVTQEELKNAFQQFGTVVSVGLSVWKSPNNQKEAKFGFIAYANSDDAKKANQQALENQTVRGLYLTNEPAYINLHQSKEKRNEYIQSKKRLRMQMSGGMFPGMGMDPRFAMMNQFQQNRRFGNFPSMFPGGSGPRNLQRGGFQPNNNRQFQPNPNRQQGPRQQQGNFQQGGNRMNNRPNQQGFQSQGQRQQHQQTQHQHHQQHNMMNQQRNQDQRNFNQKPQQQQQQQQQQSSQQQAPLTALIGVQALKNRLQEFLSKPENAQREILGELLFPKVKSKTTSTLAPRITGMLIDLSVLEVSEILEFLEDEALLTERVQEAVELIESEDAQ